MRRYEVQHKPNDTFTADGLTMPEGQHYAIFDCNKQQIIARYNNEGDAKRATFSLNLNGYRI